MSGDYGSTRFEYRDNPNEDANRYDNELNKIRGNVSKINNQIARLESIFREISNGQSTDSSKRGQVVQLENSIHEMIVQCQKQHQRLTTYRISDRGLRAKAERVKREFETAVRKYHDLAQAVLEAMKTQSAAGAEEDGLLVDVGDGQRLVGAQVQANREADLALQIEQEQEMERLANDIANIEELFQDLHGTTMEQGEMVDSIGNDVNQAYDNVEQANVELAAAVEYKRKVRKRCIILVVVLIVILAIIGLIVGLSVSGHK